MKAFRLKIKRLDFISAVDAGAQGPIANVALIKRAGKNDALEATCRVFHKDEKLGLVFGWALATTTDGGQTPHVDLQDDAIVGGDDLIKVAAAFMEQGGASDVMHDGDSDGRIVFAMPLVKQVNDALGIESKVEGLAIAMKPSAETFKRFLSGELNAFSIAGVGEREVLQRAMRKDDDGDSDGDGDDDDTAMKCGDCGGYMKADAKTCVKCGGAPVGYKRWNGVEKQGDTYEETAGQVLCVQLGKRAAVHREQVRKDTWTTAYVDDLPDSSFLYVEGGGKKDDDGKTVPRSLRHFPYRDENGKVDIPHLRDAIGRIPQSSLPATLRNKLQVKAEKLLAKEHGKDSGDKRLTKRMLLTTAVAGHTHMLNDGDGAQAGTTDYSNMPGDANGGYHSHPWVRNTAGAIVIGEAENHTHMVADVDAIPDDDEDDADAAADKRARKSTPSTPIHHGEPMDEKKQLAEALAKIARLEKKLRLTDAQRAYYKRLPDRAAKDAFLAKSVSERDEAVKAAVVYTSKADGAVYYAGDDERLVAMAKSRDEDREKLAKRDAELDAVKLTKQAEALAMPGSVEVRKVFLKAADAVTDEKLRVACHAALKTSGEAMERLFKASDHRLAEGFELPADGGGTGSLPVVDSPETALRKYVEKYQADHKIATYQQAFAKAVREDAKAGELYAATKN